MYGLMAIISLLVRQFLLPNPFECFGSMAEIYNWIAGVVISPIAFALVGLIYHKGDFPALGSFLYLVAYAAITGVLMLMGIFSFAWWWILAVVAMLVVAFLLLAALWRWLSGDSRQFD